jgi:hypothetical protein
MAFVRDTGKGSAKPRQARQIRAIARDSVATRGERAHDGCPKKLGDRRNRCSAGLKALHVRCCPGRGAWDGAGAR